MENVALMVVALLPLGLVAVSGYLWLKRRNKKAPALKLVETPSLPKVIKISAQERIDLVDMKPSKKKKRNKRKPARGKRK